MHAALKSINKTTGWTWPVARLLDVHDGDTIKLAIDHGFGEDAKEWIRLKDVRAPELSEGADAGTATEDVKAWFKEYAPDGYVQVTTFWSPTPLEIKFKQSFTRYIGVVTSPGSVELNAWLRAKGWIDRGE